MGDEKIAIRAFKAALFGDGIDPSDVSDTIRISKKTDPYNHRMIARCALIHGDLRVKEFISDDLRHTSREVGSGLYDSWSYAAISTVNSPAARRAYLAWLAIHRLCLAHVGTLRLVRGDGATITRRRNYNMARYRGAISIMAGNRFQWDLRTASLYHERALSGPLVTGGDWHGYDHPTMGWAMQAAKQYGWDVDLPNGVGELVKVADRLPMMRGQRMDILKFEDGRLITVLAEATHPTRGPVMVTDFDPEVRLMDAYVPSEPTSGGEWSDASSTIDGDQGVIETRSGSSQHLRVTFVPDEVKHWIVWDSEGCRLRQSGSQPPSDVPNPVPETTLGLIEFDKAGHKIRAQGYFERDEVLRTAAEVMRRITEDTESSALAGARTLVANMERFGW